MFESISFIKLTIIAIVILLALFATRKHFRLHFILTWALISFTIFALYTYKSELGNIKSRFVANLMPGKVYQEGGNILLTKSSDGHFYIDGYIGGNKAKFLIDTGASQVLLKHEFSNQKSGLRYTGHTANFATAGGIITAFEVVITQLTVGHKEEEGLGITFHNARAYIVDKKTDFLEHSLLGMSLLKQLDSYKFEGDKMIIEVAPEEES